MQFLNLTFTFTFGGTEAISPSWPNAQPRRNQRLGKTHCSGLLSTSTASKELQAACPLPSRILLSDSEARELAITPASTASGSPSKGLGIPWLVDGVRWGKDPVYSVADWESIQTNYNWEEVPVDVQECYRSIAHNFLAHQ